MKHSLEHPKNGKFAGPAGAADIQRTWGRRGVSAFSVQRSAVSPETLTGSFPQLHGGGRNTFVVETPLEERPESWRFLGRVQSRLDSNPEPKGEKGMALEERHGEDRDGTSKKFDIWTDRVVREQTFS